MTCDHVYSIYPAIYIMIFEIGRPVSMIKQGESGDCNVHIATKPENVKYASACNLASF